MATSKSISHILSPEGPNNLFSVDFGLTTIKSIMNSITKPGHQTEEGVEGDEGDGDADQDPNCSPGTTPIRDMVDIPGITKHVSRPSIMTDTDGSKW